MKFLCLLGIHRFIMAYTPYGVQSNSSNIEEERYVVKCRYCGKRKGKSRD